MLPRGHYRGPTYLEIAMWSKSLRFSFMPVEMKAQDSRSKRDKSFIGSYVLGMGFTFDDTDTNAITSSIAEMKRVIAKDARNAQRIFPYLGGEEINQ